MANKKKPGARLSKKTNRKQNLKKFLDGLRNGIRDKEAFLKACKNDENLLIYTCLTNKELNEVFDQIEKIETIEQVIKYLVNNQPYMNINEERYNRCVDSIATYLKNYITYNGFLMNNGSGDAEDWSSEFWLKYVKICNFYRERWFHPENLKKSSTVIPIVGNPNKSDGYIQYKEFVYICRMSITGERRHRAFLATQNPEASLFKTSLDFKLDGEKTDTNKSLLDVVKDPSNSGEYLVDRTHVNSVIDRALEISTHYEGGKYTKAIAKFYGQQDTQGIDKKIVILGKIFLYKAGLHSVKTLTFIKSLSSTYKAKFNISPALVNKQLSDLKSHKVTRKATYKDTLEDMGETYVGRLLRKRGTV